MSKEEKLKLKLPETNKGKASSDKVKSLKNKASKMSVNEFFDEAIEVFNFEGEILGNKEMLVINFFLESEKVDFIIDNTQTDATPYFYNSIKSLLER